MNKSVIFGALAFFVSCQAMDKPMDTMRIVAVSNEAFEARRNNHELFSRNFERIELAARVPDQRSHELNIRSPFYNKYLFNKYVKRESYPEVLLILTHSEELPRGCPLARDLLNVYNGKADGFPFDPAQHPNIPIWALINTGRWLAEKGGNRPFLKNYKMSFDPCYQVSSSRDTFSSSSHSSSQSDGEDSHSKYNSKSVKVLLDNQDDDI